MTKKTYRVSWPGTRRSLESWQFSSTRRGGCPVRTSPCPARSPATWRTRRTFASTSTGQTGTKSFKYLFVDSPVDACTCFSYKITISESHWCAARHYSKHSGLVLPPKGWWTVHVTKTEPIRSIRESVSKLQFCVEAFAVLRFYINSEECLYTTIRRWPPKPKKERSCDNKHIQKLDHLIDCCLNRGAKHVPDY